MYEHEIKTLIKGYTEHSATDNYILTITIDQTKMACLLTDCKILTSLVNYDKSRKAVRFRPNKQQKELIMANAEKVIPLCSTEYFKAAKAKAYTNKQGKEVHYNAGEIAEKLVTEYFKQTWEKDNLEWWNGGDLIDQNGKVWQIKDESNATFCHYEQFIKNGWAI